MASKELQMVLEMLRARPVETGLSIQQPRAAFETGPQFPLADDVQREMVNTAGVTRPQNRPK